MWPVCAQDYLKLLTATWIARVRDFTKRGKKSFLNDDMAHVYYRFSVQISFNVMYF